MTHLDSSLKDYRKLKILNLSANFLSSLEMEYLPSGLQTLELMSNRITSVNNLVGKLPKNLIYLGLSRNLLTNGVYNIQ